jgi:hypothetical protein
MEALMRAKLSMDMRRMQIAMGSLMPVMLLAANSQTAMAMESQILLSSHKLTMMSMETTSLTHVNPVARTLLSTVTSVHRIFQRFSIAGRRRIVWPI